MPNFVYVNNRGYLLYKLNNKIEGYKMNFYNNNKKAILKILYNLYDIYNIMNKNYAEMLSDKYYKAIRC